MSQAIFTRTAGRDRSAKARSFCSLLAVATVALLAGCANRDSVVVGSIPDDYRTNHPIVIAEKNQTIDIPVGVGDRGITRGQKVTFEGYLQNYDRQAAPTLTIMTPSGGANDVAASHAARGLMNIAMKAGVPRNRIAVTSYQAEYPEASSPIRVVYSAMRAQTGRCGRWPADIGDTTDNKHYANFGCSYQNNLAAQIANPADLLGPRKQSEIDAENRNVVIDQYRKPPAAWNPETFY
ncbi:CpaD family pilus assembly protein [Aminobacter sp. NyZ550]|jgi:pilus assembly protein CpaD|uniref:CpaD family pilus assembly protein n=1 Tax=Aminobacter sp. NyZ550 TaxID=2979870 RepID=UPI0021D5A59B|nr:CpaD family pilus assembly protein [Aminobacter sp. NyZ550]WAX95294.1 CpaD family pilus assembly protein [Aminobacter sp. NyZ550]